MAFADRGEEAAFDDQVLAIKALLDKGLIRHWALSNEVRRVSWARSRPTRGAALLGRKLLEAGDVIAAVGRRLPGAHDCWSAV